MCSTLNAQENREGAKSEEDDVGSRLHDAIGDSKQPRLSALEQRTGSSMFHDPHFSRHGCGNLAETLFILAFRGSILTSCT
jgi:hypothetical protein